MAKKRRRRTIRVRKASDEPPEEKRARTKHALFRNEQKAVKSVTEAIALYDESHPLVQDCLQTMIKISKGSPGYRGRYVGTRMRAISRIMDTLTGRPREAPPPPGAEDESKSAIIALVEGLRRREAS